MRFSHLVWGVISILAFATGVYWGTGPQVASPVNIMTEPQAPGPVANAVLRPDANRVLAEPGTRSFEPQSQFDIYWQAYQEAASMSADALQAKLSELSFHPERHYRDGLSKVYFSRLASFNAAGAFELALQLYGKQRTAHPILASVAHEWMLQAPQALLARIDDITDKPLQNRLLISILEDPATEALLDSQQILARLPLQYRRAMELRVSQDDEPAQTFERFLTGDFTVNEREAGLMTALYQWSESDPNAAVDKVLTSLPQAQHRKFLSLILREWAFQSPMEALQRAVTLERGNGVLISAVLGSLAEQDGRAAMQQYLSYKDRLPSSSVQELLGSWAMHDVSGALAYVEQEGGWINRKHMSTMMMWYAQQQPAEALLWAEEQQLPPSIMQNLAQQLVRVSLPQAEAMLEQSGSQQVRDSLIEHIAETKLEMGFEQASTWLQARIPVEQAQERKANLLNKFAYRNPAQAAEYVTQFEKPDARLVSRIAGLWAERDLSAARGWVMSLPPGDVKDRAIGGYLSELTAGQLDDVPLLLEQVSNQSYRQRLQKRINKG